MIKPLLKGFLLDKPLIAAVEGAAVAGGTEILQGTDIRIAGESARFGVSEVRWGLYPLGGSVVRLRRQIPYAIAADILLTGRHVRAPEAKDIGLISEVVPDGTALDRAREVAAAVAANGPVAVQAVLRALRETEGVPERDAMRLDSEIGMRVFMSDDAKEGPTGLHGEADARSSKGTRGTSHGARRHRPARPRPLHAGHPARVVHATCAPTRPSTSTPSPTGPASG